MCQEPSPVPAHNSFDKAESTNVGALSGPSILSREISLNTDSLLGSQTIARGGHQTIAREGWASTLSKSKWQLKIWTRPPTRRSAEIRRRPRFGACGDGRGLASDGRRRRAEPGGGGPSNSSECDRTTAATLSWKPCVYSLSLYLSLSLATITSLASISLGA